MNNAKNITVSSATAASSSSVMRRLKKTVAKLAKNRGLNVDEVRQQLIDKIKLLNQDKALGYLTFAGIINLDLPDGTRVRLAGFRLEVPERTDPDTGVKKLAGVTTLHLLWFTTWQATVSTALTLVCALPLTWALARTSFRGRSVVEALAPVTRCCEFG